MESRNYKRCDNSFDLVATTKSNKLFKAGANRRLFYLSCDQVVLLIIDNYDSFTYNLVQAFGELGAEMEVWRNDEITVDEIESKSPCKIVISPGPGAPVGAGVTLEVIKRFAGRVPLLGVCLGHQAIAEAFGGRVVRAPAPPVHGKASDVLHDGRNVFRDLPRTFKVGRYHSLVVERESLPACLEISATTCDGLIMGLRHREMEIEGVQFHPESILTPDGKRLLANFYQA